MSLDVKMALTNMTPVTPVRGAGRPQGTFAMERLMDRIARELNIDKVEVRRRNLIPTEAMPYDTQIKTRDGATMTYDSGNYPAALDAALERSGYNDFRARQAKARAEGRYLGIGIANYVEGTGRGPFDPLPYALSLPERSLSIRARQSGPGPKTALAQVCLQIGIDIEDIEVVTGDTGSVSLGLALLPAVKR